jgi:hypothetical protein
MSYKNRRDGRADFYYPKKVCPIKIGATVAPISLFE